MFYFSKYLKIYLKKKIETLFLYFISGHFTRDGLRLLVITIFYRAFLYNFIEVHISQFLNT